MTLEVISFTPAKQVITFKDIHEAHVILLKKYHPSIVNNATDLCRKFTIDQLHEMVTRTLQLDIHAKPTRELLAVTDREVLSQRLWPMLLVSGRQVKNTAFNRNIKGAILPTHTNYYCPYTPGEDPVLDVNYIKLSPQCRVLVDMCIEKMRPNNASGTPDFVLIKWVNQLAADGVLVTKQEPMHIWHYYERTMVAKGMIEIVRPRGVKQYK